MDLSPDEEHFQGRLLHQAALWDNVELLEELLSNGAEVDARDSSSRSALHAAALAERSRCLAALCSAGADLDARCGTAAGGKTALHIAAERGHVENVRVLVAAGASLHLLDAAGSSALALTERNNHRHAAQVLRDARDAQERERLSHHAQLRELVTRGDVQQLKSKLTSLGSDAELIVNLTPGGANTLLYAAAEAGLTAAVSLLLEAGADGRAHPVTKYSPLYIACYLGRTDIVKLLLANFPHAVQQETVEKWLPLHAACLGGHAGVVSLLLEYPYPASVLNTYLDASGKCRYLFAFDVNARDARGHTALYAASALGDARVLAALLDHTVPCLPDDKEEQPLPGAAGAGAGEARVSPQRGALAHGIHAIVSRLTGAAQQQHESGPERSVRVRPARTDLPCAGDTCVAVAARCSHTAALRRLLAAGADPDALSLPPPDLGSSAEGVRETRRSRSACPLPARSKPSLSPSPTRTYNTNRGSGERGGSGVGEGGGGGWTALGVAARACNVPVVEALVGHGATDPGGRALRECARHGLTHLLEMLLATRAYPDPDNKLNKSAICERVLSGDGEGRERELTYSAVCPTTPVIINWRELRAHIDHLRMSWVRAAALRVNSQLGSGRAALHGVTRLDISNNELRLLPPELFSLLSLRYLNAAQNKLERLPTSEDPFEEEPENKGRRFKRKNKPRGDIYTAPVLQELFLQDNRLEEVPAEVFLLPALAALDLANNKLRALPPALWAAPALRDLSAALNHLRDLPAPAQVEGQGAEQTTSPSEPCAQAHSSPSTPQLGFASWSSRGSPAERPGGKGDEEQEELESGVPVLGDRSGNAVWSEAKRAHTWRSWWECPPAAPPPPPPAGACGGGGGASPLASLNLSHNQFACVPAVLACRATSLTRLNMSYNLLRSMSYVTSYPSSLRQLDLSHNEISCWPSLPQVEQFGSAEEDPLACYCPGVSGASAGGVRVRVRSQSQSQSHAHAHAGGSVRAQLLGAACAARRHLRLEGLRTLILANNMLTRIQLTTDDDGESPATYPDPATDDDDEWGSGSQVRGRLLFPLLSMLDVSCNLLRSIPPAIHELTNLSVLNISGNKEVTELPATMGLLSRLWNLNVSGCEVSEPLRSMVRSGRYKTMDIVGYLKSVLQESRPYTTMKLMLVGVQGIGKTSLLECLRQESALHHRRKPTEHWAKRMGNKSSGRGNLSTVGVDIGLWVYEKHRSSRGPVTFRTWDFGGQHEYYATHQYFLSRRSLYLVLWKVTEGRRGLAGALHWLRSIQARAPGSPVIMVATHYDQVNNSNLPESESPEALQRLIRSSIMGAPDADKMGLPRVLDSLEVSCSSRHNIRLLADIIYSVAFSVKPSGCKEPLLEQKVPATYLALEECVTALAAELKEPVLGHAEYKRLVTQYMQQKNHRMFRDAAELHQATMFLHENGVLLHYDDATLKQLYFLRPQWLCDVLAHVLTVREINPFANNGIMKAEDVSHVFKASPALGHGAEARALALSLLNKFELALSWDARVLLVPPLLPAAEPARPQLPVRPRRAWPADPPAPAQEEGSEEGGSVRVSARCAGAALRRLVLLSYVPQGFWPRLLTRVVADPALAHAPSALYKLAPEMEAEARVSRALQLPWGWKLWRSGLAVCAGPLTLASLRDVPPAADALLPTTAHEHDTDHPYANIKLRVRQEGAWCDLDVQSSACVEILLPAHQCVLRRDDGMPLAGYQSISLEPNPEILAKVLALLSDHVDLLLEDWYPSLGTRFVHTSEGRCLITRVVPCPSCLRDAHQQPHQPLHDDQFAQAFRGMEIGSRQASREENGEVRRPRLSEDSRTSDGDSGVGADSNPPSRLGSAEGAAGAAGAAGRRVAYGWTVEECILAACTGQRLHCALHDQLQLSRLAPDTLLLDVEEERRARWEQISRGAVAGRGAFGTVVRARWRRGGECVEVAVKALQPVAGVATGAEAARWERDAAGAACRAYCGLRQELCILSQLRHAHVVPLVGVCAAPLALLLALAPRGALDAALRDYRCEARAVGVRCARALLLQVARALEYLHARRILYRDLKSENVLVWRLPRPQEAAAAELSAAPIDVHVKLGDYGISRLAPPSGTKGFGGTEGFMAPEIMRYNGEEEYTEKVDCFSYGMLIYEIVTCRQPFEGHEAVKEAILEGARPALTVRESRYACCVLETMRRCWSGAAESRPSAAALVSLASAPECAALADAAQARCAVAAAVTPLRAAPEEGGAGWEVWYGGGEPERLHALFATHSTFTQHHSLRIPAERAEPVLVTAVCRVGTTMWVGDSAGRLTLYSTSSCEVRWSVRVSEVVGGAPSAVAALRPLPALRRLALALACGRLFLVTSSRPEAEGSFVLTELGAAQDLCCLTAISTPTGYEVWAGGDALYAYGVREGGVCGAERVCVTGRVTLVAAEPAAPYVFACSEPGVCVLQYSVLTKRPAARLDCSKLAPCSETLQSISIEEHQSHGRSRVTALCAAAGKLFAGTAWGCLVVADAASLRPLTVCRPYERDVQAIVSLPAGAGAGEEAAPLLATFGAHYRPLHNRYAPQQTQSSASNANNYSGYYCLLWRAHHWLPD